MEQITYVKPGSVEVWDFERPTLCTAIVAAPLVHDPRGTNEILRSVAARPTPPWPTSAFEIGAAKHLAGWAALTAGRAAHQVPGARGTTLEHPVSTETKRLWAWRFEYRDERHRSLRLGTGAARTGAERLYPVIRR